MTIIGVTPPGFEGLELGGTEDVRVPITLQPYMHRSPSRLENAQEWWLQILGRLEPGVTREQAERVLARRLRAGSSRRNAPGTAARRTT